MIQVADEVKSQLLERVTFKSTNCDEIVYFISASPEKFDVRKFRDIVPGDPQRKRATTVCAPIDPATGEYHVHLEWYLDADEVRLTVGYHKGSKKHEADEKEPYAEQVMEWLGQFFKHETAHAHIHAEFAYALEDRESKFPLPLKTSLGPTGEAAINGISVTVPSEP